MENMCTCSICNGRKCKNTIPGPGAKGIGDTAIRNYDKWREIRIVYDNISSVKKSDASIKLFGQDLKAPLFAGPVGAVNMHYGDKYSDLEYNDLILRACRESGISAFTGDGYDPEVMISACESIKKVDGFGIPTVKPWDRNTLYGKLALIKASKAFAFAMDIDAAGLPFLKNMNPPAGNKSLEELRDISKVAGLPFIVKGIMTPVAARKAVDAGASAIVVSNHGGRVMDQCPATAEVLREIAVVVNGAAKVLVDGGIRSGADMFKAIALGADAVLVARPFVNSVYREGYKGAVEFANAMIEEFREIMTMCGAETVDQICFEMVRLYDGMNLQV